LFTIQLREASYNRKRTSVQANNAKRKITQRNDWISRARDPLGKDLFSQDKRANLTKKPTAKRKRASVDVDELLVETTDVMEQDGNDDQEDEPDLENECPEIEEEEEMEPEVEEEEELEEDEDEEEEEEEDDEDEDEDEETVEPELLEEDEVLEQEDEVETDDEEDVIVGKPIKKKRSKWRESDYIAENLVNDPAFFNVRESIRVQPRGCGTLTS